MKDRTVYEVVYSDLRRDGPAGDGSHVARFRREVDARVFAAERRGVYGATWASVQESEVSARLWRRWEREGQLR